MSPRDTHPTARPSDPNSFDALTAADLAHTDVLGLANALEALGRHAKEMDNAEESLHVDCFWCETMKMLSRVSGFGEQIRKAERNARP